MLKNYFKRCAAAVLALSMVMMTACGAKPSSSQSSDPNLQVAMGRYVEEEMPFAVPEVENVARMKRVKDDSIKLLISKTPDQIVGPWYIYSTADEGKTWAEQAAPWLEQFAGATITGADFTADGGMVIAYVIYTDEIKAVMEKAVATQDFELAMSVQPKYQYASIDSQGVVKEIPIELPAAPDGGAGSPADLRVADNGDIIVSDYYSLYQFDIAAGKVKNKYQPTQQVSEFLPCGSSLAIVENGEITLHDMESGEKTESITLPAGDDKGRLSWDGEAIYYCGKTGIYRMVSGGAVLEQVVDGALTSLNMPALYCAGIFPSADKNFLGFFSSDAGYGTLQYRFSNEISTLPEKQLRVYSLYEDKNIRQAMGLYQRKHPDTQVVFDVGVPVGSTVTVSDALRTLSTQLLAGKGPDMMVLDGMPVDSYIEKNVLLALEDDTTAGLLPNVVAASREQDGKLYALPARFKVPVALADSAAADSMTNLTSLADYQSRRIKEMPVIPPSMGSPMLPIPSTLIATFYPISAPAWEKADGTLDNAAITQFLTDIKKITDAELKENWEQAPVSYSASYDLPFSAAYWLFGHIPMAYGHSFEFFNFAPCEEAISQKGDGKVFLLPGQITGAFIPRTMLGINSASTSIDAAKEFMKIVLQPEVQACQFNDGYPVNEVSFDKSAINPFPPTDDGYTYGTVEADGSYRYLQVIWPDTAYMEQMKTMIKSLDKSSRTDVIALQMVIDESASYFMGNKTIEDTVTALTEKLRLYLSE